MGEAESVDVGVELDLGADVDVLGMVMDIGMAD